MHYKSKEISSKSRTEHYHPFPIFHTGEVELENVPLRKDALRHLDMPLEVLAGFVGRVKLQIPVSHLRSEPWVIKFEQLYLVAGPIKLEEVLCCLYDGVIRLD